MDEAIDWDAWCSVFVQIRRSLRSGIRPEKGSGLTPDVLNRITSPTPVDVRWLKEALGDEEKKWFVEQLASRKQPLSDAFFEPMLDAAIAEVNPSLNRGFLDPCVKTFGHRRVNTYHPGKHSTHIKCRQFAVNCGTRRTLWCEEHSCRGDIS